MNENKKEKRKRVLKRVLLAILILAVVAVLLFAILIFSLKEGFKDAHMEFPTDQAVEDIKSFVEDSFFALTPFNRK